MLVDQQDETERGRTRYVLREGAPALLLHLSRLLFTRPMRLLKAVSLAWRMGRRGDRPLLVHFAYVAEACCIERWLRLAGIEHLHAHFGTNSAEVAMLVRLLGGPPWSFTIHGPTEFDKAQLLGLAEKVNRSEFVIAISSYGRSQLYRFVDHRYWSKVQVVHCGLDRDFCALPNTVVPAAQRLVCVGRLCEEKGQLLLVEAAWRLATMGRNFELVLAGDGQMRNQIQDLITHYDLTDRVRITGWISGKQVRDEILAARALVLPTFAEGLPVVIMEAMALQRPIISTFIAGIPELVLPGKHGWLVPAGDVNALVQAIEECLDTSPELIALMGNAARERVLARHDVDIAAAKLAKLFSAASR